MSKAMNFAMARNRTVASTCGLSIEFVKNQLHLVPPAMFAEVIAAGGTPENELAEEDLPTVVTPESEAARTEAINAAFEKIATRNRREDFTAGGMPKNDVLAQETGFPVPAKERDAAWVKFTQGKD